VQVSEEAGVAAFFANNPQPSSITLGPGAVDAQIRQAIMLCWMLLPEQQRTLAQLKAEVLRLVERAFSNLVEDANKYDQLTG
jgi:hypothetical protein